MSEEKNAPAGGAENIFGEMDVQFGDVAEAQEVMKTTNWWKIGSAATAGLLAVAAAVFAVFGADAYLKTAPADSFVFTTGLFTKGGFACGLVNGNVDAEFGSLEEPCLPLEDLDADVQQKTDALTASTRDQLAIYLDRKLNSNVLDSALAKYVLARAPNARIPYMQVMDAISDKIAQAKTELVKLAKSPSGVKIDCGAISFVGKTISFSCAVESDGVLQPDPRVTARVGVLTLMKNIQSIPNIRIKTYPKGLTSGGTEEHSMSNVQFDLEYLMDANQL